jgi:hypothetical protein
MSIIDWNLTWNMILAIATVVMALAIIATAIFAIIQLSHIKKSRYSGLLMQLHQTWESKEYTRPRRLINQHCGNSTMEEASQKLKESLKSWDETDAEEFYSVVRLANFFENLGYLVCNGHLGREDALELFGSTAKRYWELLFVSINYHRTERENPQPDAWIYFEYLAKGCQNKNRCLEILKTPIRKILKRTSKYAT